MLFFALGFFSCLFIGKVLLLLNKRYQTIQISEQYQRMEHERRILLNFMHNMVSLLRSKQGKFSLYKEIINSSITGTGAISACIYEKTSNNKLLRSTFEGLCPPFKAPIESSDLKNASRIKIIEKAMHNEEFIIGEGLVGRVAKEKKPVLISNARNDPRVVRHQDPSFIIHSVILAPIQFQNQLLGVLVIINPSEGTPFTETDFTIIKAFVEQAALALHYSELLNLEIEKNKLDLDIDLAKNIQRLLLPENLLSHADIDLDACYIPAQKVGGDLYNFFQLSPSKIAVAIADVSGKGIPASIVMAICQTSLRHNVRINRSPSEVLRHINSDINRGTDQNRFVTMIYGIIDTDQNILTLARAGHELPLLIRYINDSKVTVERIKTKGMVLGMVPPEIFDTNIIETEIPFYPNDRLFLYTDGLTESVNEKKEEFTEKRLVETLESIGSVSPKNTNQAILEKLDFHAGKKGLIDDLTLLTVERKN